MNNPAPPILNLPQSVKDDTVAFRDGVRKFLDGRTSPIAFRAYRVPMGIYEQRTTGNFMVRIRIGAGLVSPAQLQRIAELSNTYGSGIVHVTTRQDIQIHDVNIEDTPDILERLMEVGLSSRGGGGNTVRNVTACARAGVCPQEVFDVAPYAVATAEYLIADKSSFNLPRKYKLVFSGCADDCAFASVADLGFFPHIVDGVKGFAAYAGGGLGPNPAVGVKIEDFIPGDKVFEVAEAVKRLFDKHGDRSNKHRARLRYVLARLGSEEFVKLYKQEREALASSGLPQATPEIRDIVGQFAVAEAAPGPDVQPHYVSPEKTPGRVTVRLQIKNGVISGDDLAKVSQAAAKFGPGLVRTTQLQDLLITGVAAVDVDKLESELKGLSIDVLSGGHVKLVACAGAATCKLGLCLSRSLADAIREKFSQAGTNGENGETVVRISGCPNSCGNHYLPDIGFQGKALRLGGKLVPFYDVLAGGHLAEGDSQLAKVIGSVPARRIPDLLSEALTGGASSGESLAGLVTKYGDVSDLPLPDDHYKDWGSDQPFSLAGRGPGECGAGVMDVIQVDIDEAKQAVKAAPSNETIYKAAVAAARALLLTFGLEPGTDREIFTAFGKHLIEPGWVATQTQGLLDAAVDWRMGDRADLTDLAQEAGELVERVEKLFLSLDANLKFTVPPAAQAAEPNADEAETKTHSVDLLGVACPMNFVKAKLALEQIEVGEVLEVLLDDGEPVKNAPASFAEQGQEILEIKPIDGHFSVKVRRKK